MKRLLALLFCLAAAPLAAQQTIDIDAARRLALILVSDGQPRAGRAVAAELVAANPDDAIALIALSRADRALGNYPAAFSTARRAWRVAETDEHSHHAALAAAQALSSNDRRSRAQFWLRRAVQTAPDEAARARAVRDFRYVAARNPLSFDLHFSATPSDNVNGGPTSNKIQIGGLTFVDPTAQPISGIEFSAGGRLGYRLTEEQDRRTEVWLAYDETRVLLGSEAEDIAPDLTGDDLHYQELSLGWSGQYAPSGDGRLTRIDVHLATDRVGGAALSTSFGARVARHLPRDGGGQLRLYTALTLRERQDNSLRSSQTLSFGADLLGRTETGHGWRLGAGLLREESDSEAVEHTALTFSGRLDFPEPVLGADWSLSGHLGWAVYDHPYLSAEPREDVSLGLSADARLSQIEYYGFSPVISFTIDRNHSSLPLYDTRTLGLGLTVKSNF